MCKGHYDPQFDQPVITGSTLVPTAEVGHEVTFLIDSGADNTCLSGLDAVAAGLTPQDVGDGIEFEEDVVQGVDEAKCIHVKEPVILAFEEYSDDQERYSMHIELIKGIDILPQSPRSLLGRDILNRYDVEFSHADGLVNMDRRDFVEGAYVCISGDSEMSPGFRDIQSDSE